MADWAISRLCQEGHFLHYCLRLSPPLSWFERRLSVPSGEYTYLVYPPLFPKNGRQGFWSFGAESPRGVRPPCLEECGGLAIIHGLLRRGLEDWNPRLADMGGCSMRPTVVSAGGGGCNVSDSIQLLPSPKDPAMGEGLLSVLRWG